MKKILVLDFGGQYAHLIAKRFRSLNYYTEIKLPSLSETAIDEDVMGIVFSGGPSSVYANNCPAFNEKILDLDIPILGLCYGHHLLIQQYGGKVGQAQVGEYGFTLIEKGKASALFDQLDFPAQVWMSHSDEVLQLPSGFEMIGCTQDCAYAAVENHQLKRYGLQFHAEVKDTPIGLKLFDNFARICGMEPNWDSSQVLRVIENEIREAAGDKNVLLFLSGGVDSSVAFALLDNVLGNDKVLGLYINNGFMRKHETEAIARNYQKLGYNNFIVEDGEKKFLKAVTGITDPQEKRKRIGETFIKVRDDIVERLNLSEDEWLLAQGTLYPDIIESGGSEHSHVIKTHHNRVKGIQQLLEKGLVIEPLKDLYKDEVRTIGKKIGLPDEIVYRHPFPGPGLAINLLCSDGQNHEATRLAETNLALSQLELSPPLEDPYQLFALPVKSVGVQGDFRTYTFPAVLSQGDFFKKFPGWEKLETVSSVITNSCNEVNRTIYQIFQKNECSLIEAYCTKERLDMIRDVDFIVMNLLRESGWYHKVFQHLTISLPYSATCCSCSIVLRPVVSEDVMTARFAHLELDLLKKLTEKIYQLPFVDCLYYDITNKPPATFGWE